MNERLSRIKQIDTENMIWIIYLFIIGLCFYANYLEKDYFLTGNLEKKESYRKITIFIFTVAVLVYFYFYKDGLNSIEEGNFYQSSKKKNLNELSFVASTLILISGLIFLYIAVVDTDLDVELAFS